MKKNHNKKYVILLTLIIIIIIAHLLEEQYERGHHHSAKNIHNATVYTFDHTIENKDLERVNLDDLAIGDVVYGHYNDDFSQRIVLGTYGDEMDLEGGKIIINGETIFKNDNIDQKFIEKYQDFELCSFTGETGENEISGQCQGVVSTDEQGNCVLMNMINGTQQSYQIIDDLYREKE